MKNAMEKRKVYDKKRRRKNEFIIFLIYSLLTLFSIFINIYFYISTGAQKTTLAGTYPDVALDKIVTNSLYSMLTGFTNLLLALSMLLASHIRLKEVHKRRGFLYLGAMLFAVACWTIAGNPLGMVFFGNTTAATNVSVTSLLAINLPWLLYINYVETSRFSRYFDTVCAALIVVNAGMDWFFAFGVLDRTSFMYLVFTEQLFVFASIIVSFILLYSSGAKMVPGHKSIIAGSTILALAIIIEAFASARSGSMSNKIILSTGINFYTVFSIISVVNFFSSREQATALRSVQTEARSQFVNNIANQVRLPLHTVGGLLGLIYEHAETEEGANLSLEAKQTSENLLDCIDSLLDFGQGEAPEMELTRAKYYSADLLSDIISFADILSHGSDVKVAVSADVTIPKVLFGDRRHICQLLINLIFASLDHKPKSAVKADITFVTEKEMGLCLAIQLTDDGAPLEPAQISAAREIISAGNNMLGAENLNQTIGLALAAGLVDQMDGGIEISVNGKKNNVMTVAIPQEVLDGHPIGNIKDAIRDRQGLQQAAAMSGMTESTVRADAEILLADGNSVNRRVLIRLLNSFGIDPMVVNDGEAAVRLAAKRKFDMILLDEELPGLSGKNALSAMRSNNTAYKDIPAVLLTGAVPSPDTAVLKAEGFEEVLTRPYNREDLHEVLLKYLPAV